MWKITSIVLFGKIKKLVYLIDTISDPTNVPEVLRRNKDGSKGIVQCLLAVKSYNSGMGGVDLADAKRKGTHAAGQRSGG